MKRTIIAVAWIMAGWVASATAGFYTESHTYGPASPEYGGTLTFNKGNFGVEIVTQVVVRASLDATTYQLTADNEGEEPATVDYSLGDYNEMSITALGLNTTLYARKTGTFNLTEDDGDGPGVQYDGPDSDRVSIDMLTTDWSKVYTSGFENILGSGTFGWDYHVYNSSSVNGGVSYEAIVGTGGGTLTVEYHTMIPEPTTLGAGMLALAGFFVRRRILRSRMP